MSSIVIYVFFLYLIKIASIGGITPNVYWRDYTHGDIPCDAFQGVSGKYIGQFNYKANNLPGTIYTNSGIAVSEYFGKQVTKIDIKILCSMHQKRFYWEPVNFNNAQVQQLLYAVKGGFEADDHHQTFIGHVVHEDEWKIGKVHGFELPDVKGLWVWDRNGKGVNIRQFNILKYNITDDCTNQCNNYIIPA